MARFTTDEAAQYLRVSASYLNKLRTHGGGPKFAKLGARVVYDSGDLDAWINERKQASTSDTSAQGAA